MKTYRKNYYFSSSLSPSPGIRTHARARARMYVRGWGEVGKEVKEVGSYLAKTAADPYGNSRECRQTFFPRARVLPSDGLPVRRRCVIEMDTNTVLV